MTNARIVFSEEGYELNANLRIEFNQKLTDALAHGVALHFVTELRIERPRWYWFNRQIIQRRLEYRLAYHALTRSYRLNIGGLHRNFDSLGDAVRTMERIRNLYIAPHDAFKVNDTYEVTLRFFHDTALLPKPFQLSALADGKWDLGTGRMKWSFTPETADHVEVTVEEVLLEGEEPAPGTMVKE
ncbi:MAG: DUF4390 domain-containing protein [Azoarcus sp.]|nr:DUF4390 domain-containing protein [Azoarcus sp.]